MELTQKTYSEVGLLIEKGELKSALNNVIDYVSSGNKYYDENQPWIHANNDINKFNDITYTCVYMMANISNLIYPFISDTSKKIKNILNLSDAQWEEQKISGNIKINNLELLFNKIEEK